MCVYLCVCERGAYEVVHEVEPVKAGVGGLCMILYVCIYTYMCVYFGGEGKGLFVGVRVLTGRRFNPPTSTIHPRMTETRQYNTTRRRPYL